MNDVTLKELLEYVDATDDLKVDTKENYIPSHITRFCRKLQLRHGENKVPSYVIFMTYMRWKGYPSKKKYKPIGFFRYFCKLFKLKRHGNQRYYLLNDSFDLSKENLQHCKKYYDRLYNGKKEKNKTRKGKVSGS